MRGLTAVAVGLCLGYVALHVVRGFPAADLVPMVAATITSMVPQGLVLLATLVFVLAATRLGRRGAVVQQLAAVEGLAAVDVICTDKTGTLTTGRQTLDRVVAFAEPEAAVRRWLGGFRRRERGRAEQERRSPQRSTGGRGGTHRRPRPVAVPVPQPL